MISAAGWTWCEFNTQASFEQYPIFAMRSLGSGWSKRVRILLKILETLDGGGGVHETAAPASPSPPLALGEMGAP